jgi:carboxyl-terminal processing protease
VVIGERTYGKGSVQNIIPMENGTSALKLTTASYMRPSGQNIHRFPDSKEEDDWGVKPTEGFEVKLSDEERIEYYKWRRERDIIRKAGGPPAKENGEAPKQKENGEAPKQKENGEATKKKEPFRDRVVEKALEYLRGQIRRAGGAAPGNPGAEAAPPPAPNRPAGDRLPIRSSPAAIQFPAPATQFVARENA